MLGVRSAARCSGVTVVARQRCFSAYAGSVQQNRPSKNKTSHRSRKLEAVFRSLATTLSPPLRGRRSRPASSPPRRKDAPKPVRSLAHPLCPVSKPAQGEIHALDPLFGLISDAPAISAGLHSPSGLLNLPDPSVRPVPPREARLAKRPIVFCSPPRFLSIALRIDAPDSVSCRLATSSRKPWN
jgi:hypothetical protein